MEPNQTSLTGSPRTNLANSSFARIGLFESTEVAIQLAGAKDGRVKEGRVKPLGRPTRINSAPEGRGLSPAAATAREG
jgi:hypothetical protein